MKISTSNRIQTWDVMIRSEALTFQLPRPFKMKLEPYLQ